jgi:hypothetical protein
MTSLNFPAHLYDEEYNREHTFDCGCFTKVYQTEWNDDFCAVGIEYNRKYCVTHEQEIAKMEKKVKNIEEQLVLAKHDLYRLKHPFLPKLNNKE